jgi:hypothetical protein
MVVSSPIVCVIPAIAWLFLSLHDAKHGVMNVLFFCVFAAVLGMVPGVGIMYHSLWKTSTLNDLDNSVPPAAVARLFPNENHHKAAIAYCKKKGEWRLVGLVVDECQAKNRAARSQ